MPKELETKALLDQMLDGVGELAGDADPAKELPPDPELESEPETEDTQDTETPGDVDPAEETQVVNEDDSVDKPGEGEDPEEGLSHALVMQAARMGLEDADVLECATDAELERLIGLAKRFGGGKEAAPAGEKRVEPPTGGELEFEVPEFQMPDGAEPDEELSAVIKARDEALLSSVKKGVTGFLEARQQAQEADRIVDRFDSACNAMDDWKEVVGSGYREDLDQPFAEARSRLFGPTMALLAQAQKEGRRLTMPSAVKQAFAVEFGKETKKRAAADTLRKVRVRTKVRRPGGSQTKPLSDDEQILVDIENEQRRRGLPVSPRIAKNPLEDAFNYGSG